MKQLIKFSKPSKAVIKNKSSFFNDNDLLLEKVKKVNSLYLSQPKRTRCKTCGSVIKDITLEIHDIPYSICKNCGHFNGLHEDTEEFAKFLYSDDEGKNYSSNYIQDYKNRVTDIYEPKVNFLQECLHTIDNNHDFDVTDIGCGAGHFVKALENSKISAVGYDTNKQLVELGGNILQKNTLELIRFEDLYHTILRSHSSVLSLVGVLEHLMDPIRAIESFNRSESRYLYLQVPLFSFSALLESVHPTVFPRQLNAGHTHLYTKKSINYLCDNYDLNIIGEWWFGTDMVDLFRHLQVLSNSSESKELSSELLGDVIDDLQSPLDKNKICSGVNMVLKKN